MANTLRFTLGFNFDGKAKKKSDAGMRIARVSVRLPPFGDRTPVHARRSRIPYDKGGLGHSDADVLLHAITDALLGAVALGDIGLHFPDTDPAWKDADSRKLLRHVVQLLREKGWTVGNMDCTVVLEQPKLRPTWMPCAVPSLHCSMWTSMLFP